MASVAVGPVWSRWAMAVLGLALVVVALDGCGSSSKPAVSAAGTPLQQSCAAVAAVLGNGPDESEDPVGYAEAQILPLRALKIQDAALERSVVDLSNAYRQFYATQGAAAAQSAVKAASAKVDATCPGATS